jgi:hypothetical protein
VRGFAGRRTASSPRFFTTAFTLTRLTWRWSQRPQTVPIWEYSPDPLFHLARRSGAVRPVSALGLFPRYGSSRRIRTFDFTRFRRTAFRFRALFDCRDHAVFYPRLNFGIDFGGGTLMEVRAKSAADIARCPPL